MDIEQLLTLLGQQLGLGALALDENGVCRLVFDEKLDVDIEPADDGAVIHVYAVVGQVPPGNREALFAELLSANLFGRGTGGATLAIDQERNEVMLSRRFEPDATDLQVFVNEVERFVNYVELWAGRLRAGEVGREAPPAPGPRPGTIRA